MAGEVIALGQIRVEKSYEALANKLREQILNGEIPMGAVLPNERELSDKTGLSRGSVREALRILEAEGLVTTHIGRSGGRIARIPGAEGVERSLDFLIRGQQVQFATVLETMEALEPALAELAAKHRTSQDIEVLDEISRQMADPTIDAARYQTLNSTWHLAVARASHNVLLVSVMQALGPKLHDPHVDDFISPDMRDVVLSAHMRVQRAIIEGDAAAARRRMARHLCAYRAVVEKVGPETIVLT